jgi:hypothetical protein
VVLPIKDSANIAQLNVKGSMMDNFTVYIAIPLMFLAIVFLFFAVVYKNSQVKMYYRKWQEVIKSYNNMKEYYNQRVERQKRNDRLNTEWRNKRAEKAEAKGYKYNHLVSTIPNTKENRAIVAQLNKMMKLSESKYRLIIKYRKPKDGYSNYQFNSHVRQEDALLFSVYLRNKVYEN